MTSSSAPFVGLALAGVAAYLVYWGGRSLPLRLFFKVTGVVLIVFAAGLLARTVLYLQSAGDLGSFNLNGVYDVRAYEWLDSSSEVGKFLAAMFGWDPRPSIEQVVVWLGVLRTGHLPLPAPGPIDRAGAERRARTGGPAGRLERVEHPHGRHQPP